MLLLRYDSIINKRKTLKGDDDADEDNHLCDSRGVG